MKQNIEYINEMFSINGKEYAFIHYWVLGAEFNKEDIKGLKHIIYVRLNKNKDVIEYLYKKDKIK